VKSNGNQRVVDLLEQAGIHQLMQRLNLPFRPQAVVVNNGWQFLETQQTKHAIPSQSWQVRCLLRARPLEVFRLIYDSLGKILSIIE
jgi:hypothetical protein